MFFFTGYLVRNRRPSRNFFEEGAYYIFRNLRSHMLGRDARFTFFWKVKRIQMLWEQLA